MILAWFFGLGWFMILIIIGMALLLPLVALIDIVRNDFDGNNKLLWVLIVIFLPFLGSILYFAIGRDQRHRRY